MHGKEHVIAPLAARFLGLRIELAPGLDTDRFGTFARDVARSGTALDAARGKIGAALALTPGVRVALASEGSFGPHPAVPFAALNREIVVLVDRAAGFELVGHYATADTNFAHAVVRDVAAGMAFADRVGFPRHGVIVMAVRGGAPAPDVALWKDLADRDALHHALADRIARGGNAHIETDMRAHRNPRRMRAIKRAMIDLVRRAHTPCPACGKRGVGVVGRVAGLPCTGCGTATALPRADLLGCPSCGWRGERPVAGTTADPGHCAECNP